MTIKIMAATRLRAYTVPMAQRPGRIQEMMKRAGCDKETAESYLAGEDWSVEQALWWYKADKKDAAKRGTTHK